MATKVSIIFFSVRMNVKPQGNAEKAEYKQTNSQSQREFLKEIADNSTDKNSFANVKKSFGNDFKFFIAHQNKVYHNKESLSIPRLHSRLPLLAAAKDGGIFGKGDSLLASLEESYIYIFELSKENKQRKADNERLTKIVEELRSRWRNWRSVSRAELKEK